MEAELSISVKKAILLSVLETINALSIDPPPFCRNNLTK